MSDTEGKETDKEKLAAAQNEKEEDTSPKKPMTPSSVKSKSPLPSGPSSARTGSKAGSKPGSGVAKTTKSPQSSAKGKQAPKAASVKGQKSKAPVKTEEKREDTPAASTTADETEEDGLPEGVVPLFMASKTQEIFSCVCDEHVTKDEPFKLIPKADILEDMKMRAAISDFSVVKQQILDYPGDEILVVYDYEFKYEQNFYVALTEEAKERLLNPPVKGDGEDGMEEEEEEVVYTYVPPESKEWVSLGSEKEIQEESVVENRRRVKQSIRRKRAEFGASCTFQDRNVGDAKDGYVECTPYDDQTFDLKKIELDKGLQAIPEFIESGTQTDWKYPRNANTQYYPREYTEQERDKIASSKPVIEFANGVSPRFELALQQNEIMNVFFDDWINLGDSDNVGNKADNHLKEYQSFTDLQFSKEKRITSIQWHPTIKGVVAVAVAERLTFDERIDHAAKVIMTPSLILIWSFTDPIHPQMSTIRRGSDPAKLLLEAPDDIFSFQFNPVDPNIIVGGCYNGQVVLWDISAHADRLKAPRGGSRKKEKNVLPGFEDPNALKTPIVRYCAVSSIENSHKGPITDIQWLPDHMEVNRMGIPQENRSQTCIQLMTCATDHCVLFWDTRPTKGQQGKEEDKGPKNPMGIPNTFRHLDLQWKPHLRVTLHKSEPGGDHSPTKFTIQEKQGDRTALAKATESVEKDISQTGGFSFGTKPGSGKEKKTLQTVNTHFYVGTEDGEVVFLDWMPQKDQDTGKIMTPKPDYYHSIHDGPCVALQRSPFFNEVVLCVGGWTFSLWKENVSSGPILFSAASTVKLSAAHWSPTRPGVFYIAKVDGSVDVWDLLDKTHEPSITQSVSPSPITTIYPFGVTKKQQLLAVGDDAGTLHILEIPWSLRQPTPNEVNGVSNYIEREVKRRGFVVQRWDFREAEKREIEAEAKRKAGIAPNVVLTDEELEYKAKMEYHEYLKEEANFLRELGLKVDEEEPLPEV